MRAQRSTPTSPPLDGTPRAHLATVLPDGAPHSVPLWVDTHGDQVVIFAGPGSRKARTCGATRGSRCR